MNPKLMSPLTPPKQSHHPTTQSLNRQLCTHQYMNETLPPIASCLIPQSPPHVIPQSLGPTFTDHPWDRKAPENSKQTPYSRAGILHVGMCPGSALQA